MSVKNIPYWRITFGLAAVVLTIGAILVLDKIFAYKLVEGYVNQIAQLANVNSHAAQALTWTVFAIVIVFGGLVFSFDKKRRIIGYVGFLGLLILNSLILYGVTRDHYFALDGTAAKCFILNRDEIRYGERPGFDPYSGRFCQPVTAEMRERLKAYEKGSRPRHVDSSNVKFFDERTGEPIVWFARIDGRIQLFDLMGYHPETGQELVAINNEVITEWRSQFARDKKMAADSVLKAPERVTVQAPTYFDPATGNPLLWFWKSPTGQIELYNNKGFHPRTGESLRQVTRDVVADWQRERDAAERNAREHQRNLEEQRKREFEAAERTRAEQARLDELAQQQADLKRKSAEECDRLAANPYDSMKSQSAIGAAYDQLRANPGPAIEACEQAVRSFPAELRYQYQLARAHQPLNPKISFTLFHQLAQANYAAAFDNLGWLYLDGRVASPNRDVALRHFQAGAALGDADSMLSVGRQLAGEQPQTAYAWFLKAAELGHRDAQAQVQQMAMAAQRSANQQRQNEEAAAIFGQILGGFVGGIRR